MPVRYFKIAFESKKTKHPKGKYTAFYFAEGNHKKMAYENALEQMLEIEPDNVDFYKLPVVDTEYKSVDEYLEAEPKEPVTFDAPKKKVNHAAFNDDESKGVTDNDLRFAASLIVLYGLADEYTDKMNKDSQGFADAPFNGTPEEQKAFGALYESALQFMPAIFTKIEPLKLLSFLNHLDHHLNNKSANVGDIKEIGITFITDSLNMEYQTAICETDYKEVKSNEVIEQPQEEQETIDVNLFKLPCVDDIPEPCTFDDDVKEINGRIDALPVGGSFFIDGLSNAVYHASNAYSKSSLDIISRDPSLIEWAKNAPRNPDKEETLIFGSAFHTMVLEPHLFDSEFLVMPPLNLRTNAGKEEKEKLEHAARRKKLSILSNEQLQHLKLMHGSVFAHPTAKKLFKKGIAERSIFFRVSTSLVVRIRPDWIAEFAGRDFIVDLKSCPDAAKFGKSIEDYRYHVQDAFYSWVYEQSTSKTPVFAFCATGKAVEMGRYPTRLVLLDAHDKEVGKAEFQRDINTIEDCLDSGIWGGFETVQRPQWARRNDEF